MITTNYDGKEYKHTELNDHREQIEKIVGSKKIAYRDIAAWYKDKPEIRTHVLFMNLSHMLTQALVSSHIIVLRNDEKGVSEYSYNADDMLMDTLTTLVLNVVAHYRWFYHKHLGHKIDIVIYNTSFESNLLYRYLLERINTISNFINYIHVITIPSSDWVFDTQSFSFTSAIMSKIRSKMLKRLDETEFDFVILSSYPLDHMFMRLGDNIKIVSKSYKFGVKYIDTRQLMDKYYPQLANQKYYPREIRDTLPFIMVSDYRPKKGYYNTKPKFPRIDKRKVVVYDISVNQKIGAPLPEIVEECVSALYVRDENSPFDYAGNYFRSIYFEFDNVYNDFANEIMAIWSKKLVDKNIEVMNDTMHLSPGFSPIELNKLL